MPFLRTIYSDRDWAFGITVVASAVFIIVVIVVAIATPG
jgi:hypothetical protein